MWNPNNGTNELLYKTDVENKLMVMRWGKGKGINWEMVQFLSCV